MWINTATGKVLLTHSDIRRDIGNVSLPAIMEDAMVLKFGYLPITQVAPDFDPLTQKVAELPPALVNKVWTQQWGISDMTSGQIEARRLAAVPKSISPRQIRQALTAAGLRASVEAAVAAGDQDLKDWYGFSTYFERSNPQVVAMGVALAVPPLQLDALWTLGATL